MKKIILITDALGDPRIQKRILLFKSNGYETKLFAFKRGEQKFTSGEFPQEIIGDIGELPYFKRLPIILRGINRVVQRFKNDDNVVFYLFGIQVAIIFRLLSRKTYIYEEADLVHTYIKNNCIKRWFENQDKKIILHSKLSIFTSEGFVQYHFPTQKIPHCIVIANKLKTQVQSLKHKDKAHKYNKNNIHFGFVGGIRFESTIHFIEYVVNTYPQHVFHLYGIVQSEYINRIESLEKHHNFINHGAFSNPNDLPEIYSNIDYVLSTYDTKYDNVRYAEPNKLYESIYFRVPIIVSENTFLAKRVEELNSGVSVNALDNEKIDELVKSLTYDKYSNIVDSLRSIEKSIAVESNDDLSEIIKHIADI